MIASRGVLRCFQLSYNHVDCLLMHHSSQLSLPRRLSFPRASFDYQVLGFPSSRLVSPSIFAAEKEEAKAVLTSFLKKQGLTESAAQTAANSSDSFVDHLVSELPHLHQSPDRVGRELSTLEIRDALIPYLESFLEEHGDLLVDFVENFPKPVDEGKPVHHVGTSRKSYSNEDRSKLAVERVHRRGPDGTLSPNIVYLMNLGLDLKDIEEMARIYPSLPFLNLERKLMPVVELFLGLGVPKSNLASILIRCPSMFGYSISEKLYPAIEFLESLGMDKKAWVSVIERNPMILPLSRKKMEELIGFFDEVGVPAKSVGEILTKYPNISSCSVEDNLRPTAKFFHSLGVDVARLLRQHPRVFGLSIEKHLKPIAEFFLEKGYSGEEFARMIARYGGLWNHKLETLSWKYDYFLTLGYPREELIKCPMYFSFNVEGRLEPRLKLIRESGLNLTLSQVLRPSDDIFRSRLAEKLRKLQSRTHRMVQKTYDFQK